MTRSQGHTKLRVIQSFLKTGAMVRRNNFIQDLYKSCNQNQIKAAATWQNPTHSFLFQRMEINHCVIFFEKLVMESEIRNIWEFSKIHPIKEGSAQGIIEI